MNFKPGDLVVCVLEPDLLMGILDIKRIPEFNTHYEYQAECLYFNGTSYEHVFIPVDFLVHRDETLGPENVRDIVDNRTVYVEDGDRLIIRTVKHVS